MFILEREERGLRGEKEKETLMWERHWLVAYCVYPEWGSNPQLFGAQDGAPTNWNT